MPEIHLHNPFLKQKAMAELILHSNMNSSVRDHDNVNYEPIESQFYKMVKDRLYKDGDHKIYYRIYEKEKQIVIEEKFALCLEIKGKLKCSFSVLYDSDSKDTYNFKLTEKINAGFNCNKDIGKQFEQYMTKIIQVMELYDHSKGLYDWNRNCYKLISEKIEKYLNNHFNSEENKIKCSFRLYETSLFQTSDFDNYLLDFYIYPKVENRCPADGTVFCIDKNGKCILRVSDSKHRWGKTEELSDVFQKINYNGDSQGMKEKLEDMLDLEKRVANFDGTKCPEIMLYIEKANQAMEILSLAKDIK